MYKLVYLIFKIASIILRNRKKVMSTYFRLYGIKIGENCNIISNVVCKESFLIEIGNNVTISNSVQLITHDASINKIFKDYTDIFGKIVIKDNCFVGAGAKILPGITLEKGTIVAAGSVVTKSFNKENIVIAGNPAKVIGDWDALRSKYKHYAINIISVKKKERKKHILDSGKLISK